MKSIRKAMRRMQNQQIQIVAPMLSQVTIIQRKMTHKMCTHLLKPKTPFFTKIIVLGRYGALKNLEKFFSFLKKYTQYKLIAFFSRCSVGLPYKSYFIYPNIIQKQILTLKSESALDDKISLDRKKAPPAHLILSASESSGPDNISTIETQQLFQQTTLKESVLQKKLQKLSTNYKRLQMRHPGALTFNFNTDGAQLFESAKRSLWPLQLYINELPPEIRFKHLLIAALMETESEPTANRLNLFMETMIMECQQLGVDDPQGQCSIIPDRHTKPNATISSLHFISCTKMLAYANMGFMWKLRDVRLILFALAIEETSQSGQKRMIRIRLSTSIQPKVNIYVYIGPNVTIEVRV
ncbi:unnamed protein product [Trichogramma brassicae]|uniref:Uncharacterized protein n=1 Tax=Trichogramma brassicae TaxID=86971 RepID=A0A6H5INA5_9HYME|nr:unnamed protein product [Trichogramma brassicae]